MKRDKKSPYQGQQCSHMETGACYECRNPLGPFFSKSIRAEAHPQRRTGKDHPKTPALLRFFMRVNDEFRRHSHNRLSINFGVPSVDHYPITSYRTA